MHFGCVDPPIDFAAHALFSASFGRTASGAERFNADNVIVIECIELRAMPVFALAPLLFSRLL